MSTKEFEVSDFTRVKAAEVIEVQIVRSDTFGVSVTFDDLNHVRVEKTGDTLRVGRKGLDLMAPFHGKPQVVIKMPELTELTLSGASHGRAEGFKSGKDLSINVNGASHLEVGALATGGFTADISGASSLTGDVSAGGKVRLEVSGASRAELTGSGNDATIEITGASHARLANFVLSNADVDINGASHAQLDVTGKMEISLNGASRLEYRGNPTLGKVKVTGASTLDKK